MSRVLLIAQKPSEAQKLTQIFRSVRVPCEIVATVEAGIERISKDPPALIVAEKPESIDALHSLKSTLQAHAPATPFLVTASGGSLESALAVMQAGAYDCLAKPYSNLDVLSAAKRATAKAGRLLFVAKLRPKKRHPFRLILVGAAVVFLSVSLWTLRQGPPPSVISLGSANLAGIQWAERNLWVADWYESTVTHYELEKGLLKNSRALVAREIYRVQDSQPVLVCDTPDFLVSIGSDLKMRIHQRSVGLPAFQTFQTPALNPTGLAWDGKNVWSSDGQTNLLYKHADDLRVLGTVRSILPKILGLAWDGEALWVAGGNPLRLARLKFLNDNQVWEGPFDVKNLLPQGVAMTGMAIGFGRLWAVSGGDPKMVSVPLPAVVASPKKINAAPSKRTKNGD